MLLRNNSEVCISLFLIYLMNKHLLHIFNVSLQKRPFPDEIKISRATPLFRLEELFKMREL